MVLINGTVEKCHVKNTGRCRELLIPGARVFLEESDKPERKTRYSVIAVYKGSTLINMDSQAPNQVAVEWVSRGALFTPVTFLKREVKFGNSRFDIYAESKERKIFLEVKGVTLENDGVASFPDAPTERGVKHIYELCEAVKEGYEAYIIFVIQMKGIKKFVPNDETHKALGDALRFAKTQGVNIVAVDCMVTPESLEADQIIPVELLY